MAWGEGGGKRSLLLVDTREVVLQRVAVCGVLQCVSMCYVAWCEASVLQRVAMCCSVLHSVLQCFM